MSVEALELLFRDTRPHTVLDHRCTDCGGEFKKRFDDLKQRVESAYVEALRSRATSELDSAADGGALATWGVYEDTVRKLGEDANDAKDQAKAVTYGNASKEIFRQVNGKVEALFTPEYVARVRATDLLSDPGNWEVAGGYDSVKSQFTGKTLVVTNEGDAAKFGGIFYKASRNWRDYVIEFDFMLDTGALTLYTRAEVMDVKHVPGVSIGKEKCDVNNIEYGKTMSAVISVIGGKCSVSLDGQDVKSNEAISINFPRKGPVAIAINPGTRLRIMRLQVRHLR